MSLTPLKTALRLRTSQSLAGCTCLRGARFVHSRPNLPYDIAQGVLPFLSAKALRGTAIEWHQGNLDRLNDLARNTPFANSSVAQTVIGASKAREHALVFAYASEALNNGFFLSSLTTEADKEPSIDTRFVQEAISHSFGSMTSFINYFSSYANGMFGTGYVWLVMDEEDNLAVLGTYGAGTILVQGQMNRAPELEPFVAVDASGADIAESLSPQAASRSQSSAAKMAPVEDLADPSGSGAESSSAAGRPQQSRRTDTPPAHTQQSTIDTPRRASTMAKAAWEDKDNPKFDYASSSLSTRPGRTNNMRFANVHPLMCLSLHPHVYIPDYGIMGKEKYIEAFWHNLDWDRVNTRYDAVKRLVKANNTRY